MLPKNKQRYWMMRYLKIYAGPYHPHQAQFMPLDIEKIYETQVKDHTNYVLYSNSNRNIEHENDNENENENESDNSDNDNENEKKNRQKKIKKKALKRINDAEWKYGFETYEKQTLIQNKRTPIDRRTKFKNAEIRGLLLEQAKQEYLMNLDDDTIEKKKKFNEIIKDIKDRERLQTESVIGITKQRAEIKLDEDGNEIMVVRAEEREIEDRDRDKNKNEGELYGFPRLSLNDRRSIPNYIRRDRRHVRPRYLPKLVIKQGSKEEKLYLNYMEKQEGAMNVDQQRKKAGQFGSS